MAHKVAKKIEKKVFRPVGKTLKPIARVVGNVALPAIGGFLVGGPIGALAGLGVGTRAAIKGKALTPRTLLQSGLATAGIGLGAAALPSILQSGLGLLSNVGGALQGGAGLLGQGLQSVGGMLGGIPFPGLGGAGEVVGDIGGLLGGQFGPMDFLRNIGSTLGFLQGGPGTGSPFGFNPLGPLQGLFGGGGAAPQGGGSLFGGLGGPLMLGSLITNFLAQREQAKALERLMGQQESLIAEQRQLAGTPEEAQREMLRQAREAIRGAQAQRGIFTSGVAAAQEAQLLPLIQAQLQRQRLADLAAISTQLNPLVAQRLSLLA